MKTFLLTASATLAILHAGNAATIVWQAQVDNFLAATDGSPLRDDSLVRIGYFNFDDAVRDAVIATNATTLAGIQFLNSNFVEFGSARIGDNLDNRAGYFADTDTANTSPSGLNLEGKQIYLWAFASGDDSSVNSSINTVRETGVFYLSKAASSRWAFPSDTPIPGATEIELTNLTGAGPNAGLIAGATIVVGSYNSASDPDSFQLATVIPEPSAALLGFLGAAGLLFRRRRA